MKRRTRLSPYRVPSPVRAKAIALPREIYDRDFWRSMAKALVAIVALMLIVSVIGCVDMKEAEKVDYGPAVDQQKVLDSVYGFMISGTDPTKTKQGAFVHFVTTDNLAGGTLKLLSSETGQTVVSRTEDATTVKFNIVEKTIEYHQNSSTPEKLTRSFDLGFDKAKTTSIPDPTPVATTSILRLTPTELSARAAQFNGKLIAGSPSIAADPSPTPTPSPTPVPTVTFHHLRTWEDKGPPPDNVQSQNNCAGIPNCLITYRHVVFDIVQWYVPEGALIHMELIASPDVPQTIGLNMNPIFPYLPGLMKSCFTQMIDIGTDGRNKTLLAECRDVINFTYDASSLEATPAVW